MSCVSALPVDVGVMDDSPFLPHHKPEATVTGMDSFKNLCLSVAEIITDDVCCNDNYRLYGIVIGGICCIKVVAGIRIKAQPLSGFRR